jgi:L-malate glycosyltransferase
MRILVINHEYPPIGGGGGQSCQAIVNELARRGHEIIVLTAHLKGLPREELINNVRLIRLPSFRKQPYKAGFLTMGLFVLSAINAGYKIIRDWRPVLIHVHFAVPGGAAAWVLHRMTGVPYVLTAHLGDIPGGVPEKTGKWFRLVYPLTMSIWKHAAQSTAVSAFTASLVHKQYGMTPQVIPNGMDMKTIEGGQLSIHEPPVVIFVGRFVQQKNLMELVEVLNLVRDVPWSCTLVGDGPLHDDIQRRIDELGLHARFVFTGWASSDEVRNCLGRSDILFMPSLSEGLPMVGIQALASGLAIVANKVGGFSDLVEQNLNGYLAEPGDRKALSEALRRYLSDSQVLLKARQSSLERAGRFDIKTIVDSYETVFRKAVTGQD